MTIKEIEIQLALGSLSLDMKRDLACAPDTPEHILTTLAEDDYWNIRYHVAKHPNVPVDILIMLSTDARHETRSRVAGASKTPTIILLKMIHDKDVDVRCNAKFALGMEI